MTDGSPTKKQTEALLQTLDARCKQFVFYVADYRIDRRCLDGLLTGIAQLARAVGYRQQGVVKIRLANDLFNPCHFP